MFDEFAVFSCLLGLEFTDFMMHKQINNGIGFEIGETGKRRSNRYHLDGYITGDQTIIIFLLHATFSRSYTNYCQ